MSIPRNFYETLSLCSLEFNNSFLDSLGSDEDSGNEDVLDMEYTEAEAEELRRNAEVSDVLLTSPWVALVRQSVLLLFLIFTDPTVSFHCRFISAPVAAIKWPSFSPVLCSSFLIRFKTKRNKNKNIPYMQLGNNRVTWLPRSYVY